MSDDFGTQDRTEAVQALPAIETDIPVAAPIVFDTQQPAAEPPIPIPGPDPTPFPPHLPPEPQPPFPPIKQCNLGFRDGCYAVTIRLIGSLRPLVGTLRVDRGAPAPVPTV